MDTQSADFGRSDAFLSGVYYLPRLRISCGQVAEKLVKFSRKHGGDETWLRDVDETQNSMAEGRVVALVSQTEQNWLKLIGVSYSELSQEVRWGRSQESRSHLICDVEDRDNAVVIGGTIIHAAYRGGELGEVAAAATLMIELCEKTAFAALIACMRPGNLAVHRAIVKLGATILNARAASALDAEIRRVVADAALKYASRNWEGGPDVAILHPAAAVRAARVMIATGSSEGFALPRGGIVRIGPGWQDPGFWRAVRAIAGGKLPYVRVWEHLDVPQAL